VAIVLIQAGVQAPADERTVSGVVVDADDRPVEDASLLLSCGVMPDGSVPVLARATSGDDGRFRLRWPGVEAIRSAGGYDVMLWTWCDGSLAMRGLEKAVEPRGAEVQIKFQATTAVQFRVVGPSGEAVKGVRVSPFHVNDRSVVLYGSADVPDELAERLAAVSNDEGIVEFNGLPARLEVWRLRVTTPDGYSQVLLPGYDKPTPQPIVLAERAGRVAGRVVDQTGRPIAGKPVEIWSHGLNPVAIDGKRAFRTADDGEFSVPPRLLAGSDYRVVVRVAGTEPCYSASFELKRGEDYRVPDLVLRPLRTVEGRVRDRAGEPIVGARVMQAGDGPQRTETRTDEQGRFRLGGFRQGDVFVVASATGFRFGGQVVDAKRTRADVVLTRIDELPARSLKMLPPVLPVEQERQLALELLKPLAREALEKFNGPMAFQLLSAMAEMEPTTLIEWLGNKPDIDPRTNGTLLYELVRNLAKEDLDEAVALATSIKDESLRVHALVGASLKIQGNTEKRIELLNQAQVQAQAAKSPAVRIELLSLLAGRWFDLGRTERARELLHTAAELAEKNDKDPFVASARWRLAENLAPLDLPAALELLKELKQDIVRDRPYLLIAIRLARTNPEVAERIFEKAGVSRTGESGGLKNQLCQRMALTDLPRARRLAASIDESVWRTRALFLVAQAVAESNPAGARELINEAVAELVRMAVLLPSQASYLAAGSLPLIERIDPSLVEECIWRALALRAPMCDVRDADRASWDDAGLARGIALYDRRLASQLFRAYEDLLEAKDVKNRMDMQLEALVLVDPSRAVKLATGLAVTAEDPRFPIKKFTIMRVARLLGRHDEARRRAILEPVGLWDEDNGDF
jgi:hypothetical protein